MLSISNALFLLYLFKNKSFLRGLNLSAGSCKMLETPTSRTAAQLVVQFSPEPHEGQKEMSRDISKGVQSKFSALVAIQDVGIGEKWTPRQKVILNSNNNNNNNNNNKKEQTIISKHSFRTWSRSVPQIWYLHLKYTVLGTAKQRDGQKKDKRLH